MNTLICAMAISTALGQADSLDSDFETALGTAGLTTRSARFDDNLLRFFRSGEFTTPLYEAFSENPWRIPFFVQNMRTEAASSVGSPSGLVMLGSRALGVGTRRTLLGNPNEADEEAAKKENALDVVLQQMKAQRVVVGNIPSTANVPREAKHAAALILRVMQRAVVMRRIALTGSVQPETVLKAPSEPEGESFDALYRLYKSVDLEYLFAGGHDLVKACETAQDIASLVPPTEAYRFELETIWGKIVLTGGSDDTHEGESSLLIIDTGGNDTYYNPARNGDGYNWASVVIDTTGNDKYLSTQALKQTSIDKFSGRKGRTEPGPCGALFGYSILIDRQGNDLYRTNGPGLGSAKFGVAVLLDKGGDDTYDAYADAEGFGQFGIGILEDQGGSDTYSGFTQVQGVGLTMGFGMLVDHAGNDKYLANDTTIDFPSAQSAQHNNTMGQGAGYGRRADYSDGHSLGGGVGILFDEKGNDEYSCGVFGQGVGYWEGVGMLWDSEGADTYTGQWYVQGAAAHFAIGYLEDSAGDDHYTAPMNMALGAGHDFSVGFFIDGAGNDHYKAPNLSLGAGNANGMGIFLEMGGNDVYDSSGLTLGRSAEATKGSLRSRAISLGLFIDFGGSDTYPAAATWAKDATRVANWTDKGFRTEESQLGIFWDR